jgi:hypothetical protein
MEECLLRCRTPREAAQVGQKKKFTTLEKWLLEEGKTREGCDLSCNIHTGIRLCPVSLVIENLNRRSVATMTETEQRHALEMLLREEEEYLKLQMYFRDNRFRNLLNETDHRS